MTIQLYRGNNTARLALTPVSGHPVWTTDTKRLYVGDGSTAGGIPVDRNIQLIDPSLPPFNAPKALTQATCNVNASTELTACIDALTPEQAMWVGGGFYRVNTSLLLKNAGAGTGGGVSRIIGNNVGANNSCGFVAGMTDGTAVIQMPNNWFYGQLENFAILTKDNLSDLWTGMNNGTWTNQNAVGINSSGANYSRDFSLREVFVRGLKRGYNLESFILDLDNLYAYQCEIGYFIRSFNGARAFIRGEFNYKDLELHDSAGSEFLIMFEAEAGWANLRNSVSSTVDGVNSCRFTLYMETAGTKTNPYMIFGGANLCQSISVLNTGGGGYDYMVPGLKFDKVNGATVQYPIYSQPPYGFYESTANTLNVFDLSGGNTTDTPAGAWLIDNSKAAGNARNMWPNSNFDHWFGGWAQVVVSNLTVSKETTIVRKGPNSMKLVNNTAAASNMYFLIDEPQILNAIKGRKVMIGAWVYLPANTYNGSTMNVRPTITIQSYNGTTSVYNNGDMTSTRAVGGAWNWMCGFCNIQSDITFLAYYISPVESIGGVCPASYTIYVDSIVMVDATVGEVMARTYPLPDAGCCPRVNGGLLEYTGSSLPAHSGLYYNKGDRFWDTGVAAGGSPGKICTTAGAGNAATFKAMASVAA